MPRVTPQHAAGRSALLLAVAVLALASLLVGAAGRRVRGLRRVRPARRLADEFPQREAPAGSSASWPFQPTQLNVDLSRGAASVPVLLVPVPVPGPPAACDARALYESQGGQASPSLKEGAPEDGPEYDLQGVPEPVLAPPPAQPLFTWQQLLEEFQTQKPLAPELPPMVLSSADVSERAPLPYGNAALAAAARGDVLVLNGTEPPPARRAPPPPYHRESLALMRARVTVPRADYTEPYTVWFDPVSGDSRVDFHGGATSAFRSALPDGRERLTLVWVQRWDGARSRRCATATAAAPARPSHPALPDLAGFAYAGAEGTGAGRVEVWQRVVESAAGAAGAARGEALTARHELRLQRVDGAARPLRYSVAVDSSALGADCDGYEHVYEYLGAPPVPSQFFEVDLDAVCDAVELLDATRPEHLAHLQPLREFTQPLRDARYDQLFDRYRARYGQRYAHGAEEALRRTVLMHNVRFAAAANRQGATSRLRAALLADRLHSELRAHTGGVGPGLRPPGSAAPPPSDDADAVEQQLPSAFDWRDAGAVSPVLHQGGNCSSCWAVAVTGAVECALQRRRGSLVPLSPKALVDCGQPFKLNGCNPSWCEDAYLYVQERGLPKLEDYQYKPQVGPCRERGAPSQTRISGYVKVAADDVAALQESIWRGCATVVVVNGLQCRSFVLHAAGVLQDERCANDIGSVNHAVLAVGWDSWRGEPHFILKNSWSAAWGERGYVRVHARSNTVGVLAMPTRPTLGADDVGRPPRA